MKARKRVVSLVLAFFICVSAVALPAHAAAARQLKLGIGFVNASALRLRAGASTATATLDYAPRGDVVVLLEKTGAWYKVIYNLQTGYVHGDYLRVATRENAELGYGALNANTVNVRSGPGTSYGSLRKANAGERVYIIGINQQWFKVIIGQSIGYIRSDYVDLTEIPYENADSVNKPLFFRNGQSTGIKPSADALNNIPVAGATGQAVVQTAKQYIGVPYLWGGTTPKGFDCSGFVRYVFNAHGISLPRTSAQQYTVGQAVDRSQLQAGDLIFSNTSGSGVSHVGIYVGEGQFIHASSSKGVVISDLSNFYWSSRYIGARRVL